MAELHRGRFVTVAHADEGDAAAGNHDARSQLRLRVRLPEGAARAHDFARGFHFGPEDGIGVRELDERKHRLLDREIGPSARYREALLFEVDARHGLGGDLRKRQADGLRDERNRARGARVDLEHVHDAVLDRELGVHDADDAERGSELPYLFVQGPLHFLAQTERRQRASGVAGVHPRLLDVLHDSADDHFLAVGDAVDVDLDGEIEETVEQHGALIGDLHGLGHVLGQVVLAVDDLHGPPAEHVRRAHDERITDLPGQRDGFLGRARGSIGRLLEAQPVDEILEAFPILGEVDRIGRGADDRHAGRFEIARELERGLSAELHDDAAGLFPVHDLEHVLERQRLEIEPVGGVVVGRDRLRIAVDHDGLETRFAERESGMHATVVELDALADPVRPAAEDHDLVGVRRVRFALLLVGRIHVRGVACELGRATVDALEHGPDPMTMARIPDRRLVESRQRREPAVAESLALEIEQAAPVERVGTVRGKRLFRANEVLDLGEKPRVDRGQRGQFIERHAEAERVRHVPEPLTACHAQLVTEPGMVLLGLHGAADRRQAVDPGLEPAQRLLQRLLEGPADRHDLADRLHLRRQAVFVERELLEREPRDLGDHVVDRRLEGRRRRSSGDLVAQFVERVADRELRRDLGDRKPRGL